MFKILKSNLLKEECRLGWGWGGVILQRGEEKWETGRRRQHSVLRFHRGHVLVGTPHPTRTPAVPTQHPDPRPGSRPSPAQEPQNPPLSLSPAPQQAQASLLFTVPPSPQPSSRLQHPALSTSFQGTRSASAHPQPWCPLFPVWSTGEKCGRRLSGRWEQAVEAAGAGWRKGVP